MTKKQAIILTILWTAGAFLLFFALWELWRLISEAGAF